MLAYIDISHNMLSGSIPETWLDNPRLKFFSAGFNNLSGQIPGPHVDGSRLIAGWFMHCAYTLLCSICTNRSRMCPWCPTASDLNCGL